MLFSSDDKAETQKKQMMAELEKRKAEALRLHQTEEAQRLEAICNRLEASLKLHGVPDLELKNGASGSGELRLKLGDSGGGGHAGIRGLPGIALNDNTGNGGTTPYGIAGLPGIYTNGPGGGSATSVPADPVLSLKTGDGSPTPPTSAPSAGSSPSQPASADTNPAANSAAGALDPRNMTPQQMADMATEIESLPLAEQQRLMDAAANAAKGTPTGVGTVAPPKPSASVASSQPAASQLQQIAGASQAATTAAAPEDAAALARTGFDTPAAGVTLPGSATPVALSGSTGAPHVQPSVTASLGSTIPVGKSTTARLVIHSTPPPLPLGIAPTPSVARPTSATGSGLRNSDAPWGFCPSGVEKAIPSRQQLQTELAVRRAQLESLQNTILRFNRTIQLDQQQYAVWQDEAEAAKERLEGRLWDLPSKLAFDWFVEEKEDAFKEMAKDDKLTAFDREQWRKLDLAKNLKSFDEFRAWALSNKSDWGMIDEGFRQLVSSMPLNTELNSYVNCTEDLIDNAYDLTDLLATMDNVQSLDHNSAQYPEIVRHNGEQVKVLVARIREIEQQLNETPVLPPGTPACVTTKAAMH
jgi:hypothetical protein